MSIDLDAIESRIATGIYGDDRLSKKERNDAFSALAEIIAEVERLRAEVGMLQQEARIRKNLCDGFASEADEERAAVMTLINERAEKIRFTLAERSIPLLKDILYCIERGEHLKETS